MWTGALTRITVYEAALYTRVSTLDQHSESQMLDLHHLAQQRGYEIVAEYTDHRTLTISRFSINHTHLAL